MEEPVRLLVLIRNNNFEYDLPIISVANNSKWANIFIIQKLKGGKWRVYCNKNTKTKSLVTKLCKEYYDNKIEASKDSLKCYIHYYFPFLTNNYTVGEYYYSYKNLLEVIAKFDNHNLSCNCSYDMYCHADFLINLIKANNMELKFRLRKFLRDIVNQRRRITEMGVNKKHPVYDKIRQVESASYFENPCQWFLINYDVVHTVCPSTHYKKLKEFHIEVVKELS